MHLQRGQKALGVQLRSSIANLLSFVHTEWIISMHVCKFTPDKVHTEVPLGSFYGGTTEGKCAVTLYCRGF